jgi:hypothetical protein
MYVDKKFYLKKYRMPENKCHTRKKKTLVLRGKNSNNSGASEICF